MALRRTYSKYLLAATSEYSNSTTAIDSLISTANVYPRQKGILQIPMTSEITLNLYQPSSHL